MPQAQALAPPLPFAKDSLAKQDAVLWHLMQYQVALLTMRSTLASSSARLRMEELLGDDMSSVEKSDFP
eukprot:3316636-Amphidinium_carterae.1